MTAFNYFLDILRIVADKIFRHEAISGTGITFMDIGIFFLILTIVVNAIVVSVRASDDLSDSALSEKRSERLHQRRLIESEKRSFEPRTVNTRTVRNSDGSRTTTSRRIK